MKRVSPCLVVRSGTISAERGSSGRGRLSGRGGRIGGGIVLFLLIARASPLESASEWGPILQCLRSRSVWIMWESASPGQGEVICEPEDGSPLRIAERGEAKVHRIRLGDLAPETHYTYRCFLSGEEQGGGSFTTAPEREDGEVFFFVCSDTGEPVEDTTGNLEVLFSRIREGGPDFVLHAGDFTQYSNFREGFLEPWSLILGEVMLYTAPGNHETMVEGPGVFTKTMITTDDNPDDYRETTYSFDWGPLHVVVLDTVDFGRISDLADKEREFMEEDFASSAGKPWRIMVTHYPPYTATSKHQRHSSLVEEWIVTLCRKYEVDLLFCGHVHSYQRSLPLRGGQRGPTPYGLEFFRDPQATVMVTTGAGREVYPLDWREPCRWLAKGIEAFSYAVVKADRRRLSLEAVDLLTGEVIDRFTIEKTHPLPETIPPVIKDIRVSRCGWKRVAVEWWTDEPTEGEVVVRNPRNVTRSYPSWYFKRHHTLYVTLIAYLPLSSLSVVARDRWGNETESAIVSCPQEVLFLRGDTNLDGVLNLADALGVLYYVLGGDPVGMPCAAAADSNGDGEIALADSIYLLGYIFSGGPPPPPPFPEPETWKKGDPFPCEGGGYWGAIDFRWWW